MIDFKNMPENERLVYACVKNATIENLKPRKDIEKATGLSKRKIEQAVVTLRNKYGIPVYALKRYPVSGYFIAKDEADKQEGTRAYESQINTSIVNLGVMRNLDVEAYWREIS